MAVEMRAQKLIITDARDYTAFRRYVKEKERSIFTPTMAFWKKQSEYVTVDTAKIALRLGAVPNEWKGPWAQMTREYVRDDVGSAWLEGIKAAGAEIAKKVNRLQRKQFEFDSTMAAIKAWLDAQGGALIRDLTAGQLSSIHALLQSQIALGVTSPYILAQRIKPIIGLTEKKAAYLARVLTDLTNQGLPPNIINKQIDRLGKTLHKRRAMTIAQTEISNAYNFGQYDSIKQAAEAGELPGIVEKDWMAGGPNPCDPCLGNEGAGIILLEALFPSGHARPTAHPVCACGVSYSVRR